MINLPLKASLHSLILSVKVRSLFPSDCSSSDGSEVGLKKREGLKIVILSKARARLQLS